MGDTGKKCSICGSREQLTDTRGEEFCVILEKLQSMALTVDSRWMRFICVFCKRKIYDYCDFTRFCSNAYQEYLAANRIAQAPDSGSASNQPTQGASSAAPIETNEETPELTSQLKAPEGEELVEAVHLPEVSDSSIDINMIDFAQEETN